MGHLYHSYGHLEVSKIHRIQPCWLGGSAFVGVFGSQPSISNLGSQKTQKNIEKAHHPDFLGFSIEFITSIPEILSIPGSPVASRDIPWHPLTPNQSQWHKPGKNEPRKAGLTAQMTRFMKPPQKVASSWPQWMADSDSPSTGLHTEKGKSTIKQTQAIPGLCYFWYFRNTTEVK